MDALWWVWIAAGLILAILEVVVPGYLFAGFAIGAVAVGGWMGLSLPGAQWLGASLFNALVAASVVSILAWLALRQFMGVRKGQKIIITDDINER